MRYGSLNTTSVPPRSVGESSHIPEPLSSPTDAQRYDYLLCDSGNLQNLQGGPVLEVALQNIRAAQVEPDALSVSRPVVELSRSKFNTLASKLMAGECYSRDEFEKRLKELSPEIKAPGMISAIERLVQCGVLRVHSDGRIERTSTLISFRSKNSENFRALSVPGVSPQSLGQQVPFPPVAELTRQANPSELALAVSPKIIAQAAMERPELLKTTSVGRAFGTQSDDMLRFATLVAFEIRLDAIRKVWGEGRHISDRARLVKRRTGYGPEQLKECVFKEVCSEVHATAEEILLIEALNVRGCERDKNQFSGRPELKGALSRVISGNPQDGDVATILQKLSLREKELSMFLARVVVASKRPLFEFLESVPAISLLLGKGNLASAKKAALTGAPLSSIAREIGRTRAGVSAQVKKISSMSPIVEAAIKFRVDSLSRRVPPLPSEILEELSKQVILKPKECFEIGLSVSSDPLLQSGESVPDLYKRVFLAAFAGAYRGKDSRTPAIFQTLPVSLTHYMSSLVVSAADRALMEASNRYLSELSLLNVRSKLAEDGDFSERRVKVVTAYLKELICNPDIPYPILWEKVAPQRTKREGETIYKLFGETISMHASERAREGCAIFDEKWTQSWITQAHRIPLIRARFRDQGSMEYVAAVTGLDHNNYSTVSSACVKMIPALKKFTPRR